MDSTGLIKFDAAMTALATAHSVDEVKDIRDKAEAARKYAKQAGMSLEGQNMLAEIGMRAERKAGGMLREMIAHQGGRPKNSDMMSQLSHLGISRKKSSRWQKAAEIPENQFEEYCAEVQAKQKELTRVGLFKFAKQDKATNGKPSPVVVYEDTVSSLIDLIQRDRKFRTIYADPPWAYGNQATRAATSNHYQTMTVEDICAMPIAELVEDNAHLHLWATNAFLFDVPRVMEAWGFAYKSVCLWVKPQMGIGNYWRVCHEFLFFGMRGDEGMGDARKNLRSWYEVDRTKHSAKPPVFRELIEKVSPSPRLELFGRAAHSGWAVFGNDILGQQMYG